MQQIPVTFQANPAASTVTISDLSFNQLMNLVVKYLVGTVNATVSFFLTGSVLPVVDQGVLFYSTVTGYFYAWSGVAGAYVPTGQNLVVGDVLFDYTNADELARGYVLAAGSRTIDSIAGLSASQNFNLHVLLGAGAGVEVPNVTAPTSTVGGGSGGGGTLFPKIFCGF